MAHAETFHPGVGPVAEAEALYLRQLRLEQRLQDHAGEFVVWDVGLGAAANPLTLLRATHGQSMSFRILSFDHTVEPLRFALEQAQHLPYLNGFEVQLERLLIDRQVAFQDGSQSVRWELHIADFPALLRRPEAREFAKPHVIMFDAFSPAKNPAMWTQPLFSDLFKLLDPARPCVLPTYSRSTLLRVTLLLAGFFVGVGHATGEKEETTIAANSLGLIEAPLDQRWLARARRSSSAEPLWEPHYRQAKLSPASWGKLELHPQFQGSASARTPGPEPS